ncbi:MAG TPA: diguanylate cyclase [Rhodanobacteraceae bacterium]
MEWRRWACLASVVALLVAWSGAEASATIAKATTAASPTALLIRAERINTAHDARFAELLRQLHQKDARLTPAQRLHLALLDALQYSLQGDDTKATSLLRKVIKHSDNPSLSARAVAQLMQIDFLNRRYEKAYKLANTLVSNLPNISEPVARLSALNQMVQLMNRVGQYDLALKYARQIQRSFPSPSGQCAGSLDVTQSLLYAGKLTSASPRFRKTIDVCLAAHLVISANALRLDLASLLTDEGHMDRSIALLDKIAPSIRKSGYKFHMASLPITYAQAYVKQGNDAAASKSALAALSMFAPGKTNWIVEDAYKVLYQVDKRAGQYAQALAYYEKYVAQAQASADDTRMRSLAYQLVKQEVLANKMQLDALHKKNQILKLRQRLAEKAVETSRLYITLILAALILIMLWLLKIKHSQLRFRRQARHDGLTGVFNRQHFLHAAKQTLGKLHHSGRCACLLMLDLDHFKRVNDSHGHAAGDEVLKQAVATCQAQLRTEDVLGRLGGEEFGILIPGCSPTQGLDIANRMRDALAAMKVKLVSDSVVMVSASFGLACSERSGHDFDRLFGDADAALYRAKECGRDRVVTACDDEAFTARDDASNETRASEPARP